MTMLRLLHLRVDALRSISRLDIDISAPFVVISGANGSGKSTVLEAMTWALFGAGAVRHSEASLRTRGGVHPARAVLAFECDVGVFHVERTFDNAASATLCNAAGDELASGVDAVDAAVTRVTGYTRERFLHECMTGRRELAHFTQAAPRERMRMLARLLGLHMDPAAWQQRAGPDAVAILEQELAVAVERLQALENAPDLMAQYSGELERARADLLEAERIASELSEQWSQKRQDVQTRLVSYTRRAEELRRQITELSESGATGTCPTCEQPLHTGHEALTRRLDDEYYVATQDIKWLVQREAQLAKRPPDVAEAETRRLRLRAVVDDRADRVARCEQAMQELWTVANERKRATEQLAAVRATRTDTAPGPGVDEAVLQRISAIASGIAAVAGVNGIVMRADGRVHMLDDDGAQVAVTSGSDEELAMLAIRCAVMEVLGHGERRVMLLDEPFGSVDGARSAQLLDALRALPSVAQVILATRALPHAAHGAAVVQLT